MSLSKKEQEIVLWQDWRKGNKRALPRLLRSMDPLIQQQVNKFQSAPIPRSAIEAHGRVLAVRAFKDYNPAKGAALNTHVVNHLKHLQRFVIEYQNIGKIPEHRGIAVSKFNNIKRNLEDVLGREPTTIELAEALKWSTREVERMLSEQRTDITLRQSLEEAGWWDKDRIVTDINKELIEYAYYDRDLSMEERKILEYWFGLHGNPKLSVKEMALKMGRPESYIRKVGRKIAEKIQTPKQRYF
jgi:RNA polymerase nonessential primary-like sigma factor